MATPIGLRCVFFVRYGRVYLIEAYSESISPRDADVYYRNTLIHLGRPDDDIRSDSDEKIIAVFDSDVRAKFENAVLGVPCREQRRTVRLSLGIWPEMLKGFTFPEIERVAWGEDQERRGVPLPRTFAGLADITDSAALLRLGMEPPEMRRIVPGMSFFNGTQETVIGRGTYPDEGGLVDAKFWNGQASWIGLTINTSASGFGTVRANFEHRLRSPAELMITPTNKNELRYFRTPSDPSHIAQQASVPQ